jgi:hypothetical protein
MATFNDMVDEVRQSISGFSNKQDKINYISNNGSSISASETTITLGDANNIAKGLIEIDDELLYSFNFNKTNSTITIAPGFGRGYMDTTATVHADNSMVIINPTYPRNAIKRAINDTILAVYPKLYGINTYDFTYNSATTTYSVPNDVERILSIRWESIGPTKEWINVKRWYQDSMANTTSFNSKNSLTISDAITSGRTVQITYTQEPNTLSNTTDEFSLTTGLPESCKDVIILGAAYRLLTFLDPARAGMVSPQADETDSKRPYGASQSATKQLYALYSQRLNEETKAQQQNYPPKVHYSRR